MPAGGVADLTVVARVGVVDAVAGDCGAFLERGGADGVGCLVGGGVVVVVGRGGSVVVVMFRLRRRGREGGSTAEDEEDEA